MLNPRRLEQSKLDELDEELDEIRIKTMYEMVEDVSVSMGGLTQKKKFLYLHPPSILL